MNQANKHLPIEKKKLSVEQPSPQPLAIADLHIRYGTAKEFMIIFNKDIQPKTAQYPERAYLGTAPSLSMVQQAYNYDVVVVWIMAQLEDLNDFIGIKEKMTISQIEQTANIIIAEYSQLKVSEIHLFLHRLKAGHYGVFYGSIDPLKITQALHLFIEQRRSDIFRIENKRQQATLNTQRKEWAKTAITRQKYEQLKQKNYEIR